MSIVPPIPALADLEHRMLTLDASSRDGCKPFSRNQAEAVKAYLTKELEAAIDRLMQPTDDWATRNHGHADDCRGCNYPEPPASPNPYPTIREVVEHLVVGHDGEFNWTLNVNRLNTGDELEIRGELAHELLKLIDLRRQVKALVRDGLVSVHVPQ